MRSLLTWAGVNRITSCEKSVNKSVIMLQTCGIRKFRWREKNKTLAKILGGGRQHRTTRAGQIWGVATPATPAALTPMQMRQTNIPDCSLCTVSAARHVNTGSWSELRQQTPRPRTVNCSSLNFLYTPQTPTASYQQSTDQSMNHLFAGN